ncbi:MAG: amino acid dehydrogenase [bacterium]|nr:amino acid dehydrogenase [bacterium]
MPFHLLDAMHREGFEEVRALHDRRSGLRAFLGVHDTARGPAFGGIRRWEYRDESEALLDCLRLARAMTRKCALAELPAGGAKLVVLAKSGVDWNGAYRYIGRAVEAMGGRFYTGPDVGTGDSELACVAEETAFVTKPGPAGPGALAESTAQGVFHSIATCLRHLDGEENWTARTVCVQGLGAVGSHLARFLMERGVHVLGADVDTERATVMEQELGIELVDPNLALDQSCDVLAPCALGGLLHDVTLERLRCRIVAGGANNVLARRLHGDRLHERGILYAPDFIVNSGALIRGALFHLDDHREPAEAIGERIGGTLETVLERSRAEDATPLRVAVAEADERILAWREASG